MPQEKFKLPRSSYEELCKIIKAYGSITTPAPLKEITQSSGVNRTTISANNAFLSAMGIVEGGKNKMATVKGKNLADALQYENLQEEIKNAWREIVIDNEFLNKMIMAVKIRKGMEVSDLQTHISYSAGEKKSKAVMTGARTVIDILQNSGLVKEKDDRIIVEEIEEQYVPSSEDKEKKDTHKLNEITIHPLKSSGISFHIELRINAKPSELKGLGKELKELIDYLSKDEDKKENLNNINNKQ